MFSRASRVCTLEIGTPPPHKIIYTGIFEYITMLKSIWIESHRYILTGIYTRNWLRIC